MNLYRDRDRLIVEYNGERYVLKPLPRREHWDSFKLPLRIIANAHDLGEMPHEEAERFMSGAIQRALRGSQIAASSEGPESDPPKEAA